MTNKVVLKEVDEFMADYVPVYSPLFGLLLGKAKQYAEQVGVLNFKRLEAIGDIRNKHITPKDTEIKQISVKEGSKSFKKYFLASQYTESDFQDHDRLNDVVSQVLDEHNKHQDDLLFLGEGTSAANVANNGLFWSADANYTLESSVEVAAGTAADHLLDMHTKIMTTATKANKIAGRKVLFVYGTTAIAKLSSVYSTSPVVFRKVIEDALGSNWSIVEVPSDINLGSVNGWLAVNLDQIMLHYTSVPQLKAQGMNEEKMYTWHNFVMGSCMVEVLALYGIVRQPVTFA